MVVGIGIVDLRSVGRGSRKSSRVEEVFVRSHAERGFASHFRFELLPVYSFFASALAYFDGIELDARNDEASEVKESSRESSSASGTISSRFVVLVRVKIVDAYERLLVSSLYRLSSTGSMERDVPGTIGPLHPK